MEILYEPSKSVNHWLDTRIISSFFKFSKVYTLSKKFVNSQDWRISPLIWWYLESDHIQWLHKVKAKSTWLWNKPVFCGAWWSNSDGLQWPTVSSYSNSCCICSHHLQVWSDIAPAMTMPPSWTRWTRVGSTVIIQHSPLHCVRMVHVEILVSCWYIAANRSSNMK